MGRVFDIAEAYYGIFHLPSKDVSLLAVMDNGFVKSGMSDKSYKFIAIWTADMGDRNKNVVTTTNIMTQLRNKAVRDKAIPKVDVGYDVRWKIKTKRNTLREKKFCFSGELCPETVMDFEIKDGVYYILAECYGIFY